jgi:hypothetical protein
MLPEMYRRPIKTEDIQYLHINYVTYKVMIHAIHSAYNSAKRQTKV